MWTRRSFLGWLAAAGLPATALAGAPGWVFRGQRTALQPASACTEQDFRLLAAELIARHVGGQRGLGPYRILVHSVLSTGSMRPAIGDGDLVMTESAPYDVLSPGDVVTASNGRWAIMHRIVGGRSGEWIIKGDNNLRPDPFRVTPKTYTGLRVIAVFHTRKDGSLPQQPVLAVSGAAAGG